jgi:type IV secretory pathway TrbD component
MQRCFDQFLKVFAQRVQRQVTDLLILYGAKLTVAIINEYIIVTIIILLSLLFILSSLFIL